MADNVLEARDGYLYTNGEKFSNIIRLGINDNKDNWKEITLTEVETLQNIEQEGDNDGE